MVSLTTPAEMQAYIIERLIGDTGEPDELTVTARRLLSRAAPSIAETLTAAMSQPVGVEPGAVELARMPEARPSESTGYAISIVAAKTSPDALVLALAPDAVAHLVGALFSADPSLPDSPIRRDLSPIELQVATLAMTAIAQGLNAGALQGIELRLPIQQAVTGADLRKLVLRDGPAVRMVLSLQLPGRSCDVALMMPQRLLLRAGGDAGANPGAEVDWGAHIGDEVMRSSVTLQASMAVGRRTLGDLADLDVGQIIEFEAGSQSQAALSARNKTLFLCEFGKLGQNYTLRVRQPFDAEQDLFDRLIQQ